MMCPSKIMRSLMVILCLLLVMDVCGAIEPEWSYKTGYWVDSVAISSNGSYVVAGSDDNKVYLFDRSGKLLWSYKTRGCVESVAISSDGR